ncbi:MAG: type IV pilus assembly protein PilM [Fimbriimonadaceae bacterium]|nr:type IV pilus assembly protein PilM [Fimbriimonadaceae bacterium]QYK58567.1 MAG: type IV pilus assembly protein PilM [Fimbriimonadaceae bacterium]
MAKKLNGALGVDIGGHAIKIAEIKLSGRAPTITALGMAQVPEGSVDHIGLHDADAISEVLKQVCAQCGVSVSDAVVSVAGQGAVLVRTLEVATMTDSELKQQMDWEITRNIPFAESTIVSDFKAFPPDPNDQQNMAVVMAISPQSAVDGLISVLKKAGRKPAAIDVEPLGIARTLDMSYSDELGDRFVCVVDIGSKVTSINIYRAGRLQMPRQVPIGGEMMTRAVADSLGVPLEEAETLKQTKLRIPKSAPSGSSFNPFETPAEGTTQSFMPYNPFADPDEEPVAAAEEPAIEPAAPAPVVVESLDEDPEALRVYSAVAPVIDEFVAEVRRSIDYFRSKGGEVNELMLCGGGAKMSGLSDLLAASLGLPCQVMRPTKNVNMNVKKGDPALWDNGAEEFAVAIGNALHICY